MNLEKIFLPADLAKLAQRKGFDQPYFAYDLEGIVFTNLHIDRHRLEKLKETHGSITGLPTYQQAINWIYEKTELVVNYRPDNFPKMLAMIEYHLNEMDSDELSIEGEEGLKWA